MEQLSLAHGAAAPAAGTIPWHPYLPQAVLGAAGDTGRAAGSSLCRSPCGLPVQGPPASERCGMEGCRAGVCSSPSRLTGEAARDAGVSSLATCGRSGAALSGWASLWVVHRSEQLCCCRADDAGEGGCLQPVLDMHGVPGCR